MTRTWWRPALVGLLTVLLGAGAAVAVAATPTPPALTAYQQKLQGLVDGADHAPASGRDPASQKQTGLAAAAGRSVGNGARVAAPARSATKDHAHDAMPGDVLPDPATTGRLASGCLTGYGVPGQQCVAAVGAGGAAPTCADVVRTFPRGVAVTGKDRLKLDTDGDGTACDAGDR